LTKFWQKQFCTVFWDTVYRGRVAVFGGKPAKCLKLSHTLKIDRGHTQNDTFGNTALVH